MDVLQLKPLPSIKELINDEFYNMEIETVHTAYKPRVNDHEFYLMTITLTGGQTIRYMDYAKRPLMSTWMSFLDFSKYPEDTTTRDILGSLMDSLSFSTLLPSPKNDGNFYNSDTYVKYLNDLFNDALNHYRSAVKNHPHYYFFFEHVCKMLHGLSKMIHGDIDSYETIISSDNKLSRIISELLTHIDEYKKYIQDSIITPLEHGRRRKPGQLLLEYETFLNRINQPSCFAEASLGDRNFNPCNALLEISSEPIRKAAFLHNRWDNLQAELADEGGYSARDHEIYNSIDDHLYADKRNPEGTYTPTIEEIMEDGGISDDFLYSKTFAAGIAYFIDTDSVLRKCGYCGRYFIRKYYSTANYCNTIYKNTKATCQETVARNKYRNQRASHPIHAEYKRIYHKLYLRVRQGKLLIHDECFGLLKNLRDEYYSQYEDCTSSSQKDKKVKSFTNAAEQLYTSTDNRITHGE